MVIDQQTRTKELANLIRRIFDLPEVNQITIRDIDIRSKETIRSFIIKR